MTNMEDKWMVVTSSQYEQGVAVFNTRKEAEEAYKNVVQDYEEQAQYFRTEWEPLIKQGRGSERTEELANRQDNIQVYISKVVKKRF